MNEKLLTLKEAAPQLRLSARSLRLWIAQGKVPAKRLGRRWLVTQETVDAILSGALVVDPEDRPYIHGGGDHNIANEMREMLEGGASPGTVVDHFIDEGFDARDVLFVLNKIVLADGSNNFG